MCCGRAFSRTGRRNCRTGKPAVCLTMFVKNTRHWCSNQTAISAPTVTARIGYPKPRYSVFARRREHATNPGESLHIQTELGSRKCQRNSQPNSMPSSDSLSSDELPKLACDNHLLLRFCCNELFLTGICVAGCYSIRPTRPGATASERENRVVFKHLTFVFDGAHGRKG